MVVKARLLKWFKSRDELPDDKKRYVELAALIQERLAGLGAEKGVLIKKELGLSKLKGHVFVEPELGENDSKSFFLGDHPVAVIGGKGTGRQRILDTTRHELIHLNLPKRLWNTDGSPYQAMREELAVYTEEKRLLSPKEWARVVIVRRRDFKDFKDDYSKLSGRQKGKIKTHIESVFEVKLGGDGVSISIKEAEGSRASARLGATGYGAPAAERKRKPKGPGILDKRGRLVKQRRGLFI